MIIIINGTRVIRVITVSKVILVIRVISIERVNAVIRDLWIIRFVSNVRVFGLLGLKVFVGIVPGLLEC